MSAPTTIRVPICGASVWVKTTTGRRHYIFIYKIIKIQNRKIIVFLYFCIFAFYYLI